MQTDRYELETFASLQYLPLALLGLQQSRLSNEQVVVCSRVSELEMPEHRLTGERVLFFLFCL